jgi:hypothetical protein
MRTASCISREFHLLLFYFPVGCWGACHGHMRFAALLPAWLPGWLLVVEG